MAPGGRDDGDSGGDAAGPPGGDAGRGGGATAAAESMLLTRMSSRRPTERRSVLRVVAGGWRGRGGSGGLRAPPGEWGVVTGAGGKEELVRGLTRAENSFVAYKPVRAGPVRV